MKGASGLTSTARVTVLSPGNDRGRDSTSEDGHSCSGWESQGGPCHQISDSRSSCAGTPLLAWSAGFRAEGTCLHGQSGSASWICATRLASKSLSLHGIVLSQCKTMVESVQALVASSGSVSVLATYTSKSDKRKAACSSSYPIVLVLSGHTLALA